MVIASSVYPIRRISCSIKLQFVKNQGIQYKREIDTYVYLLPFTGKDVTRTCTFYTVLIVRKRRLMFRFLVSPALRLRMKTAEKDIGDTIVLYLRFTFYHHILRSFQFQFAKSGIKRYLKICNAECKFSHRSRSPPFQSILMLILPM